VDLSAVANELDEGAPEEFVERRKQLAAEAKKAGDADLAKGIAGLRRPTVSAWAVNRLARSAPDEVGRLLDLGAELRSAWAAGERVGELDQRRGALIARLLRTAHSLADEAGRPLREPAAREIEDTLHAATMDPEVAEEVRSGRLAQPRSYAGFVPAGGLPEPGMTKAGTSARPPARKSARDGADAGEPAREGAGKPAGEAAEKRGGVEAGKAAREGAGKAAREGAGKAAREGAGKAARGADGKRERKRQEREKRERDERERREREEDERRRRLGEQIAAAEREARDAGQALAEWESETHDAEGARSAAGDEVDRLRTELAAALNRQETATKRLAMAERERAKAARRATEARRRAGTLREKL
jgi:hypothetical protein